jgi:enamine deaminase RidA (YjgF/YER057c/UK114 family)
MSIMHINPPELLEYPGLTQVVVTHGKKTVYIAGQVSCDKQYNVLGEGDYFVQFCNVLKNVKVAVEAAGATADHVVSSIVYVKDITPEVLKALTNAWAVALDGAPFPRHAYTLVGVASLSGTMLVEISAVAIID